jgi:hypothetical protein
MALTPRRGLLIICVVLAVGISLVADFKYSASVLYSSSSTTQISQQPEIAAPTSTTLLSTQDHCPKAVRLNQGIFRDRQTTSNNGNDDYFSNVVLLTAANWGYLNVLQNWEFLSKKLGLQWTVLAMDDEIFEALGDSRAVATANASQYSVSDSVLYRSKGFNKLSCNKLRSVLHILETCQIDVVFSDCDNVFFRNPFHHDLGKMMQSRQFDYIYQANENALRPRGHSCLSDATLAVQGNTGFYYMSHQNEAIKQVMRDTLQACEQPDNAFDDQELFWNTMHAAHEKTNSSMHHCDEEEVDAVTTGKGDSIHHTSNGGSTNAGARLCCLDTYYYPVGDTTPLNQNEILTFHANYVFGKKKKIKKLRTVWSGNISAWSASRTNSSLLSKK